VTETATPAGVPGVPTARTRLPRGDVFATLDRGTATCAAALVGRVDRHWRLLTATAVPTGADPDALVEMLCTRVRDADPSLAAGLGLTGAYGDRKSVV
jgi:hypothetical protein